MAVKVAFFCKRLYMSKDVIADRYGRLYELPRQLANAGNDVRCFCLSYRHAESGAWNHPSANGELEWNSSDLHGTVIPSLLGYYFGIRKKLRLWNPDILIAASDIPHIVVVAHLARVLGKPYAVDLYDNFETFSQARLPGAKSALRRAVRGADVVTCVSRPLTRLVTESYGARGEVLILLSTVDKSIFRPRDKIACRAFFGLPKEGKLVGTAGALDSTRGIETLYSAFLKLASLNSDLHLVLAGQPQATSPVPDHPRIHFLGSLSNADVAKLFAALDVGIVCLRDTEFGRYSFPQKLLEMMACEINVVAAAVGATRDFLTEDFAKNLYAADDATDLSEIIMRQLASGTGTRAVVKDWKEEVAVLNGALKRAVNSHSASGLSRRRPA